MSVAILWCNGRGHGRIVTNIRATNFCAYQLDSEHFLSWLHSVRLTVDMWTSHECEAHTISIQCRNTQVVGDRVSDLFPIITKCMTILQSFYLCVCSLKITSKGMTWNELHVTSKFVLAGRQTNFYIIKNNKNHSSIYFNLHVLKVGL